MATPRYAVVKKQYCSQLDCCLTPPYIDSVCILTAYPQKRFCLSRDICRFHLKKQILWSCKPHFSVCHYRNSSHKREAPHDVMKFNFCKYCSNWRSAFWYHCSCQKFCFLKQYNSWPLTHKFLSLYWPLISLIIILRRLHYWEAPKHFIFIQRLNTGEFIAIFWK